MDTPGLLPDDPTEQFWWEIWLRRRKGDEHAAVKDFRRLAALSQCLVSDAIVDFPES